MKMCFFDEVTEDSREQELLIGVCPTIIRIKAQCSSLKH
jgi:hypothetical protein